MPESVLFPLCVVPPTGSTLSPLRLAQTLALLVLLSGCGSNQTPPAIPIAPATEDPAVQVESTPDAALAIAVANNWLLKPSLAKAGEVRAMLEEAKAVKPKEVGAVLEQVNLQVSIMEQAKRYDDAVALLKSGDADGATSLLTSYLQMPQAKDQEKAKQYLVMLKTVGSTDEAKTWLKGLSIEQLEQIKRDKANILELMAETEPVKLFQDGVGKIWLTNVQSQATQLLPVLRDQRLEKRIGEWDERKAKAQVRTEKSSSLETVLSSFQLSKNRLAEFRRQYPPGSYDSEGLALLSGFGSVDKMTAEFDKFNRDLQQFELQLLTPDEQSVTDLGGYSAPDGYLIEHGMGIDEIAPLSQGYRPDGDFYNSFKSEKQIETLVSGDSDEIYKIPQETRRLCLHDPAGKHWWIVDQYYYDVGSSNVVSAFTGLAAKSPKDLYLVTHVYALRESQYSIPPKSLIVPRIPNAPWTVLHFILPECPGWLVAEGKLSVSASTDKGKINLVKLSQSSKDQVLVDVFIGGVGTGNLQLQWKESSDEGEWQGQANVKIATLDPDVVYEASKIASIVRFGNQKIGDRTKFKATQQDEDIVLQLRFPSPIRAIGTFEYDIAYIRTGTDRGDYLDLETGVEILFDKARRHTLKTSMIQQDPLGNIIGLDFAPVLAQAKPPLFNDCFLRFKILKGKMFDLDKLSFRVSQPE